MHLQRDGASITACESGELPGGVLRQLADLRPILLAHVLVHDDRRALPGVQPVGAVAPGAGDPTVVARFDVVKVRLESAALQRGERLAAVVEGLAGLREGDAADAGVAGEAAAFVLDV